MLYHYTDRISGAEIHQTGVIRASPLTLHGDPFARDDGFQTPPVVWLTTSPTPDPTVVWKLRAAGWSLKPGDIWRISMPDNYAPAETWEAWSNAAGIKSSWWKWCLATAHLVGSQPKDWRVVPRDIPAADWIEIRPVN